MSAPLTLPTIPNLPAPTDALPFPVLSFSMIDEFLRCERRFFWRYVLGYKLALRQLPLEFGDAWHKGVRTWYDTRSVESAKEAFSLCWASHGGDDPRDDLRTEALAHRRLGEYAERYNREPFKILGQEIRFAVPIGEYWYQGVIDRVIEWDDGILYVKESKTTSRLGASYFKRFDPDYQTRGYVVGARETIDKRIQNVLIDATWLGKTRPREGDIFARDFVSVPLWKMDEFRDAVLKIGQEINEKAADWRYAYARRQESGDAAATAEWLTTPNPRLWVPDFSACVDYGECPYWQLCTAEPSARAGRLRTDYQKKEEHAKEAEA